MAKILVDFLTAPPLKAFCILATFPCICCRAWLPFPAPAPAADFNWARDACNSFPISKTFLFPSTNRPERILATFRQSCPPATPYSPINPSNCSWSIRQRMVSPMDCTLADATPPLRKAISPKAAPVPRVAICWVFPCSLILVIATSPETTR